MPVWFDETGQVMSDLGPVDSNCVVRVIGGHCAERHQCVLLYRAPGPRLLYGSELMSELDDERRDVSGDSCQTPCGRT